jgi:hypothetical protein
LVLNIQIIYYDIFINFGDVGMMGKKSWEKRIDPNNKYGGSFVLGSRDIEIHSDVVVFGSIVLK